MGLMNEELNDLYAAWQASQDKSTDAVAATAADAQAAPVAPAEPAPTPSAEPAPATGNATDKAPVAAPSAERKAAEKLAGIAPQESSNEEAGFSDGYREALKRTGMRDTEIGELASLVSEKPWLEGWLDGLTRTQSKQDSDFAALKAKLAEGAREPTPTTEESPGAQDHLAAAKGDQPGSAQFADLIENATQKLGDELGADNAKLLRDVFGALQSRNDELEARVSEVSGKFEGYATSLEQEKAAAEFESQVQRARHDLREQFPWIADDAGFDRVVSEMTTIPTGAAPEDVRASMEKAARIAFFDEVRTDARSATARLDNSRKNRQADTAPGASHGNSDRVLSLQEIQNEVVGMIARGEEKDRISSWQKRQFERLRASEAQQ